MVRLDCSMMLPTPSVIRVLDEPAGFGVYPTTLLDAIEELTLDDDADAALLFHKGGDFKTLFPECL